MLPVLLVVADWWRMLWTSAPNMESRRSLFYSGAICKITVKATVSGVQVDATLDSVNVTTSSDKKSVTITGNASTGVMMCTNKDWQSHKGTVTKVVVKANVYNIQSSAFSSFTKLTTVDLNSASQLAVIGEKAFYRCTALTSISLPTSVCAIGTNGFRDCTSLKTVTIASCNYVFALNVSAFQNCSSLTSFKISGRKSIYLEKTCFKDCTSMTSFTWNGNGVFSVSAALKKLNETANKYSEIANGIPEVKFARIIEKKHGTVGSSIFSGCSKLTKVQFGNLTSLGSSAFNNGKITRIQLSTVTTIDSSAFSNCKSLTELFYCGSKPKTTDGAVDLSSCTNLEEVRVVNSMSGVFSVRVWMDCNDVCKSGKDFSTHAQCKPTNPFTPSKKFTASSKFTASKSFTPSKKFTASKSFTASKKFTASKSFTASKKFTASMKFTKSKSFAPSDEFMHSMSFTASMKFTHSMSFAASEIFTTSMPFTASGALAPSGAFMPSNKFTQSEALTASGAFSPTAEFTPSDSFTSCHVSYHSKWLIVPMGCFLEYH